MARAERMGDGDRMLGMVRMMHLSVSASGLTFQLRKRL